MVFCHAGFHRIGNISKLPLYKWYSSQEPHIQVKEKGVKQIEKKHSVRRSGGTEDSIILHVKCDKNCKIKNNLKFMSGINQIIQTLMFSFIVS